MMKADIVTGRVTYCHLESKQHSPFSRFQRAISLALRQKPSPLPKPNVCLCHFNAICVSLNNSMCILVLSQSPSSLPNLFLTFFFNWVEVVDVHALCIDAPHLAGAVPFLHSLPAPPLLQHIPHSRTRQISSLSVLSPLFHTFYVYFYLVELLDFHVLGNLTSSYWLYTRLEVFPVDVKQRHAMKDIKSLHIILYFDCYLSYRVNLKNQTCEPQYHLLRGHQTSATK